MLLNVSVGKTGLIDNRSKTLLQYGQSKRITNHPIARLARDTFVLAQLYRTVIGFKGNTDFVLIETRGKMLFLERAHSYGSSKPMSLLFICS